MHTRCIPLGALFESVGIQSSSYRSPYAHHHTTLKLILKFLLNLIRWRCWIRIAWTSTHLIGLPCVNNLFRIYSLNVLQGVFVANVA